MLIKLYSTLLLTLFLGAKIKAQNQVNFTATANINFDLSTNLSFGAAFWRGGNSIKRRDLNPDERYDSREIEKQKGSFGFQPSLNSTISMVIGRQNLSNKNRTGSRIQVNGIVSPLLIFGVGESIHEQVNSFYFGHASAVLSNFASHLVLGSNFVVSPRSNINIIKPLKRTSGNVYSNENRTQQLIYVGLKVGNGFRQNQWQRYNSLKEDISKKKNGKVIKYPEGLDFSNILENFEQEDLKKKWIRKVNRLEKQRLFSINIDFPEDNTLIPLILSPFGDDDDRYFTGSVSLSGTFFTRQYGQLGYNLYKLKLLNEVYTGRFRRDLFDYPDIYDTKAIKFNSNRPSERRIARYVDQEPGQKLLNVGRTMGSFEYTSLGNSTGFLGKTGTFQGAYNSNYNYFNYKMILGYRGGAPGMIIQDWNHNWKKIEKVNPTSNPKKFHSFKSKKKFESLHHFYPNSTYGYWFLGFSSDFNFKP